MSICSSRWPASPASGRRSKQRRLWSVQEGPWPTWAEDALTRSGREGARTLASMRTEEAAADADGGRPPIARRGAHTIRWVMLGLGGGLLLALAILASRLGKDATYVPTPLIGKPAPAFTFTNLDGTTVSNADLAGRPYVVNFWASWCPRCRREHGSLRAFWERYRDKGVALLGVLYDDSPGPARAFQQELGGDWPLFKENKVA